MCSVKFSLFIIKKIKMIWLRLKEIIEAIKVKKVLFFKKNHKILMKISDVRTPYIIQS